MEDGDIVTELLDVAHLMAGEKDDFSVIYQFMHDILKQHGVDGIKAGKGFIQDDKIRVGDQRGNELDFLLVALAQRIQLFVFIRAHLQALQPVVHGGQRCEKAVRIGYGDAGFLGQLTAPGGKRCGGVRVFGKLGSHDRGAVGKLLV